MIIKADTVMRLSAMNIKRVSLDGDDSVQVVAIDTKKCEAVIYKTDESGQPYIEGDDLATMTVPFSKAVLEFDTFKIVVE